MPQRVLSFHYALTNKEGEELDSSKGGSPFSFLEGASQILPALEEALFQIAVGDSKKIELSSEKAYGAIQENLKVQVERDKLPKEDLQVGLQFRTSDDPHSPVFTITAIEEGIVHLDGNHPLAGMDLIFEVEVVAVREATAEETQHGHVHGAGGHDHDHSAE